MSLRDEKRLRGEDEAWTLLSGEVMPSKDGGGVLSRGQCSILRKVTGDASAQSRWAHEAETAKDELFNTSRGIRAPRGI